MRRAAASVVPENVRRQGAEEKKGRHYTPLSFKEKRGTERMGEFNEAVEGL